MLQRKKLTAKNAKEREDSRLSSFVPLCLCVRLLLFCLLSFTTPLFAGQVKLGIDVLQEDDFKILEGKKVGLVAHPASVDSKLKSTVEILHKNPHCKLVALFGPEHGVYADEYAGVSVPDRVDAQTGVPIFSLYGKTRKPTPEMLKGLDALVFDLQDIGSRSYTYISSMKNCLEACADAGIEFIILDRPNPLGGNRIEGPMVEKGFESFVGALSIPYLHGMTMGELARLTRDEIAPHYQKLHIIKMKGWERSMTWKETGLEWIRTSPHIPYASSCTAYAATGIIGELSVVSNGVGYTQPFDFVGAPWIKGQRLTTALSKYWSNPRTYYASVESKGSETPSPSGNTPKGIHFQETRYKPFYAIFKDQKCEGVQIFLDPKEADTLVEISFRVLWALDAPKLFKQANAENIQMFDKVCGSDEPRKWLIEKRNLNDLFEKWKGYCDKFRDTRKRALLYN